MHVWQLRLLTRMTGEPYFRELADAMAGDAVPNRDVAGRPVESRMRVGAQQGATVRIGSRTTRWCATAFERAA